MDTSLQLDLQLRSTTRASVTEEKVKLDLDVDTYNYLRTPATFCPRILVALVMPADEPDWVYQSPEHLAIRHCAYWLALEGFPQVETRHATRIEIPVVNLFSAEVVQDILGRLAERKKT